MRNASRLKVANDLHKLSSIKLKDLISFVEEMRSFVDQINQPGEVAADSPLQHNKKTFLLLILDDTVIQQADNTWMLQLLKHLQLYPVVFL